jgi:hypothetical protein
MNQKTNFIAVFSFILAIIAWLTSFISATCDNFSSVLGGGAIIMGIIGLIWLKLKQQKGSIYAYLGIALGLAACILLVTLC